uniref:PNK FHA domain-containing protein n=1 Tax=Anopheles quadriannulatus TaxID=34691 RepID=A0A182WZZ8_ANOQN
MRLFTCRPVVLCRLLAGCPVNRSCKNMSKILKECVIKPLLPEYLPIRINTEQTMVGRSPETQIQDELCSRKQVCLKANLEQGYVLVKSLGLNPSVLNGKELKRNIGYEAVHGDILELVPGMYKYVFDFIYEPSTSEEEKGPQTSKKSSSASSSRNRSGSSRTNASSTSNGKRSREESSPKEETELVPKVDKTSKRSSSGKRSSPSRSNASNSGSEKRSREESSPKRSKQAASPVPVEKRKPSLAPTTEGRWEASDDKLLHIFTSAGVMASEKVAAYDMDGTLIKTKSGNVFPKSIDDWQIAFAEVPAKLKSLHRNGYKLVIFTNQAGIGKGKVRIEDFRQKIESLVRKLGVPMQVFISTGSGKYRKPRTGMWQTLCDRQQKDDGVQIDRARSFYVGDAAGRPELKKPVKRKKDHSSADRLLALNVGIRFLTPEEHFQNLPEMPWTKPEFDPREACRLAVNEPLLVPAGASLTGSGQEVIVMVGFPGSGKSHFVREHLAPKGYDIVNRDTLGSWQKCVVQMELSLRQGKSVAVDNLSPDVESRKRYVLVANRAKVPVRCFLMDVGYKHARHNNEFREMTDRSHSTISELVFNSYKSKFQEPTVAEGFTEIVKVKFVPKFASKSHEDLYRMYLLEK